MGVDGKHTSHNYLLLHNLLSIREVHLTRSAGHLPLDESPLNQPGICRWLRRLSCLLLRTLPGIVALLATLETSTRLVPESLTRWDLLSLSLLGLHLLLRCLVLSSRSM